MVDRRSYTTDVRERKERKEKGGREGGRGGDRGRRGKKEKNTLVVTTIGKGRQESKLYHTITALTRNFPTGKDHQHIK